MNNIINENSQGLYIKDGNYVDKYNNKWDSDIYEYEEALTNSYSLENCRNCSNCYSCQNCAECIECEDCHMSFKCMECTSCNNCLNCENCNDSSYCKSCYKCNYCRSLVNGRNQINNGIKENKNFNNMTKVRISEEKLTEMIHTSINKVMNEKTINESVEKKVITVKLSDLKETISRIIKENIDFKAPFNGNDTHINEENEELGAGYNYFAIDKYTSKIVNGWDYQDLDNEAIREYSKGDLNDQFPDRKASDFKIYTRNSLERKGVDISDPSNWQAGDDVTEECGSQMEEETKPSAGLSSAQKSNIAKKAKSGADIGEKGKNFKNVAAKAAKEYGSKEAGERVAAAAMWKNAKK